MSSINIDKGLIINTIMNNSHDTIYIKDKNSAIILSSKAHSLLWGVENPEEVIGKTDFDYFPYDFAKKAYEEEQRIMRTGVSIVRKVEKLVDHNGKVTWLLASKYPFYSAEGEIIGTWGTSRDITIEKETEEELRRVNLELQKANRKLSILSTKDSLSGLYNYRYFLDKLEESFDFYTRQKETYHPKDFSLILLDIDNFKTVNDTHGHLAGDATIKGLAKIMQRNICSNHICFRYGGDEFVILLLETKIEEAKEIAKKLQKVITKTPIVYEEHKFMITVSMGIADFSNAIDTKDLIEQADKKLYLSKKSGKNNVN